MMIDIEKEVAALRDMTTGQLCERYAELFGEKPRSRHKAYPITVLQCLQMPHFTLRLQDMTRQNSTNRHLLIGNLIFTHSTQCISENW